MTLPRFSVQAHSLTPATRISQARVLACTHRTGTHNSQSASTSSIQFSWDRTFANSAETPITHSQQRPRVTRFVTHHGFRCSSSSTYSAWQIPTHGSREAPHSVATQHRRSATTGARTRSISMPVNTILPADMPIETMDTSGDYWRLYQEKRNKKEYVTNRELVQLAQWLSSNPLTKDTAAKLANLIPQFHSRKLGFNISLYNDLIHFHIKRNKFDDVQKVLNTLQTEKPFSPLSQRTLALIMAMHLKSGNTVELDRLTQRQENGIAHYMAQFVQWTRGLQLNDSHFQRAKQIFYSLQGARCEPNTPRFTHLLGHLIHSGKHAEAIQLFNHIVDIGYPVNHYTSTQIMSGLLQAKQFDKATTIWERIKNLPDRGVADLQVVNSLLEVYSQDPKRLEAAKELWIHMNQTPGLEPDQFSFASMLSAYIGSNDPTSVIELWQSMQQEPYSIKPNTVLYNLAINGLFYNRQPEQAKQLYEEFLTRQDLQSTSIDMYHTMIRGLLSVRDLEALQKILSRMERDNVKPNSTTYTLMSDILFSQHDSEGGTKMAGLIQENSLPKTAISYSALIAGHAKNGDLARAREIYEEMQAAGFEPSIHTFGALMQGAFRSGQVAVAEEMAEMAKNKIKDGMSLGAYSIMIGGYSNLVMLDDAERWFYEMQRTQSAMPWETYYVLLRACVEHREWDIAQRVLKAMKDKPFKSHVPKLNELIQQVERVQAGKPALVLYRSSHKKVVR